MKEQTTEEMLRRHLDEQRAHQMWGAIGVLVIVALVVLAILVVH